MTAILLALALLAALPSGSADAVECGAVITANTVLTADVGPCADLGVLTVVGPASLDLNGHAVRGLDRRPDHCILLEGEGATIRNGTVSDCATGVVALGTGRHRIERLTAHDIDLAAFHLASSGNVVERSQAVRAAEGFRVRGSRNRLLNDVVAAGHDGFVVLGERNVLHDNVASGLTGRGFRLLDESGQVGRQRLVGNAAIANAQEGFVVEGTAVLLERNRAVANGAGGIVVGSRDGIVSRNVAADNQPYDLISTDGTCRTTAWRDNIAGTRNAECIE